MRSGPKPMTIDTLYVAKLYGDGYGLREVAERLGVSATTLRSRLMDAGVEIRKRGGGPVPLKEGYDMPSEDLAYIVGVLMGDGNLSRGRVRLNATDKEFVDAFAGALERWSGIEPKRYIRPAVAKILPDGQERWCSEQFEAVLCSCIAHKFLESIVTVRWVEELSKEHRIAWLRGVWDSEGNIHVHNGLGTSQYHYVGFHNKDKGLLNLYVEAIKSLIGALPSIHVDARTGVWGARFGSLDKVVRFYEIVRPTISRKSHRFEQIRKG